MYFCFSGLNAVFDPDAQPISVELASAIPEASKREVLGAGLGIFGQRQRARRATSSDQKANVRSVLRAWGCVSIGKLRPSPNAICSTSMSNLPTGVTLQSTSTWTLYRTPVRVPRYTRHLPAMVGHRGAIAAGEGVGGGTGYICVYTAGLFKGMAGEPLFSALAHSSASLKPRAAGPLESGPHGWPSHRRPRSHPAGAGRRETAPALVVMRSQGSSSACDASGLSLPVTCQDRRFLWVPRASLILLAK